MQHSLQWCQWVVVWQPSVSLKLTFDQCWASDWWEIWGWGQATEASNGSMLDSYLLSPQGERPGTCYWSHWANVRPWFAWTAGQRPGFCWVRAISEGHWGGYSWCPCCSECKAASLLKQSQSLLLRNRLSSMESNPSLVLRSPLLCAVICSYCLYMLQYRRWKRSGFLGPGMTFLLGSQILCLDLATCSWMSMFLLVLEQHFWAIPIPNSNPSH